MTATTPTPTPAPTQNPTAPSAALKPTRVAKAPQLQATAAKKAPAKAIQKKTLPIARVATPKPATVTQPIVEKAVKAKKPKLVRDSFTIPKDEYAVIETLKQRAAALAQPIKKSELLRAGLKVLAGMSDAALRDALKAVPLLKTGRPKAASTPSVAPAQPSTKSPRKK